MDWITSLICLMHLVHWPAVGQAAAGVQMQRVVIHIIIVIVVNRL